MMVLSNPFPGHDALATFADLRRDLEGAVVRDAAGVMRAGVFPAHFTPLVTGRSDMRVNILDFRAVQNRGGAVFIANAGTDTSVILDAAPGANKRIDLIYVTMRSTTLGDAASLPLFGVVKGTAAPSPVVPSLPPNVADAIRLATVEIPAGATTTLSAGVVITQVAPYTTMAGGTVVMRNSTELAAWAPADGATAFSSADGVTYLRAGGAWVPSGAGVSVTTSTASGTPGSPGTWGAVPWSTTVFERGEMHSSAQPTRLIAPVDGVYQVSATLRLVTTSYSGGVAFAVNGVVDERSAVYAPNIGSFASARPHTSKDYQLSAGQYVEVMCAGQAGSLSLDLAGCSASMVRVG